MSLSAFRRYERQDGQTDSRMILGVVLGGKVQLEGLLLLPLLFLPIIIGFSCCFRSLCWIIHCKPGPVPPNQWLDGLIPLCFEYHTWPFHLPQGGQGRLLVCYCFLSLWIFGVFAIMDLVLWIIARVYKRCLSPLYYQTLEDKRLCSIWWYLMVWGLDSKLPQGNMRKRLGNSLNPQRLSGENN